jgi:ligand-binding sensor domain-containing protein
VTYLAFALAMGCGPVPSPPVDVPRSLAPIPVSGPLASHGSGLYSQGVLIRHVDDGFSAAVMADMKVDDDGWLWVATFGGLYRNESPPRRWGGDANEAIDGIVAVDHGVALVTMAYGQIAWMYRDHIERIPPVLPALTSRGRMKATLDDRGEIWAAFEGKLYHRVGGDWIEVTVGHGRVRRPEWVEGHGLWIITERGLVSVTRDGKPRLFIPVEPAVRLKAAPDGTIWVLMGPGGIARIRGTQVEPVFTGPSDMGYTLAFRGDDIWFSNTLTVRRWREGVGVRDIGVSEGLGVGGPVAVDHEGSVWVAGFLGLYQLPAPESHVWTERDGLPDRTPRTVAVDEAGTRWVVHWRGSARLDAAGKASTLPIAVIDGEICSDGHGGWWSGGTHTWNDTHADMVRMGDPPVWGQPLPGPSADCDTDADGGVWMATEAGLCHQNLDGTVTKYPTAGLLRVHQAGDTLWTAGDQGFCRAPVADVRRGTAQWTCDPIPGGVWISDLMSVGGEVWASTLGAGILRWAEGRWSTLRQSLDEPSRMFLWMSRSPRGGVWVTGQGTGIRATPDGAGGWKILERLGTADGLPLEAPEHIVESADGRLHVTTSAGLVEIPPAERGVRPALPVPEAVETRVDGVEVAPNAAMNAVGGDHELEVTYAVPSYRDPGSIRWRVRTSPDRPWSTPSTNPRFRWVGLPYGTSHIEVQVGREGQEWVSAASGPTIVLFRPWYQRWWAMGIWSACAAAVVYGVYKVRIAILLRVEQERTRIAMDLHDEIGSGLGSISLLAGMAADGEIEEPARMGIAADAAKVAQELGAALGDIVWSLRRDGGSPESLASHLLDRGGRMFDPERTAFAVHTPPTWPDIELSLQVRREVRRMAVEALNNAARHAGASSVSVRIVPGRRWTIVVEDDGRGLGGRSARPGTGLGMDGMRARAERIGATVRWIPRPEHGTIVEIVFDPQGRGRWPWQPGWW